MDTKERAKAAAAARWGRRDANGNATDANAPDATDANAMLASDAKNATDAIASDAMLGDATDANEDAMLEPVPEPERICWPPGKRVPCWLGSPAWVQAYLSRPTVDMRSLAIEAEVPAAREPERAGRR